MTIQRNRSGRAFGSVHN